MLLFKHYLVTIWHTLLSKATYREFRFMVSLNKMPHPLPGSSGRHRASNPVPFCWEVPTTIRYPAPTPTYSFKCWFPLTYRHGYLFTGSVLSHRRISSHADALLLPCACYQPARLPAAQPALRPAATGPVLPLYRPARALPQPQCRQEDTVKNNVCV